METGDVIEDTIKQHIKIVSNLKEEDFDKIRTIAKKINRALGGCGKIYFMGNGGSAADSQHLAAEFVGRFKKERKGYPAVSLTTDTSILTAVANDYGFDYVFERQIEAMVHKEDILVAISTSGNSVNVVRGIKKAKSLGAFTVGFLGNKGGELRNLCDISIVVKSNVTARIQEVHILIGHIICEIIEKRNYNGL